MFWLDSGGEGGSAAGWLRGGFSLPSFLAETNQVRWTQPLFWEVLAFEFGPLLLVPALLCLRCVSRERRYAVGALALTGVAWAMTLFLRPPGHHTDVDIHRFATAAQHWSLLHTPILAALLGRHPRVGRRLASAGLVIVVFLYLPGRLLPLEAGWADLLRSEFVLAFALPWAWLAGGGARRPASWRTVAVALALLGPVLFASWHTSQRDDGARLEPPVLFETLVPEFSEVSFGRAVLARPRFAWPLLLQGYAIAEDWGIGSDISAPEESEAPPSPLLPVAGTGFALLETSDLSSALAEWPERGFRVGGLRPVLGLNLLGNFQQHLGVRPGGLWPRLVWVGRVEAIEP